MNWEAIGAMGEVVGAVAVVVSIVYLSQQVRSNTRTVRARASFDATHSWATVNEGIVASVASERSFQEGGESRYVEAAAKFYSPDTKPGDLSPTENAVMSLLHRALFQKLEGQFYLHEHGFLETELWEQRRNWARGLVNLPAGRAWWETELSQSVYAPKFVNEISGGAGVDLVIPGSTLSTDAGT